MNYRDILCFRRTHLHLILSFLTLLFTHFTFAADSLGIDPPMRNLWSGGETRFVRQWLLLGPVRWFPPDMPLTGRLQWDALSAAGGEATVHPTAPLEQRMPGDAILHWTSDASWGDEVDISGGVRTAAWRGRTAEPELAYAYATVNREQAGDAVLSLGTDGGHRVWVNGTLVHEQAGPHVFSFDDVRVQVRFMQGENRIMVKMDHTTGPWRLALRVLEQGAVVQRIDEIVPEIVSTRQGELSVRTDRESTEGGATVSLQVLAAGGKVVEQASVARGKVVDFSPKAWHDGAYEVRCATKTPWGEPFVRYLAWYKGDAIAAARRLVEAARTAKGDAVGGTIKMLSEMVLDRAGGDLSYLPDDGWHRIHSALLEFQELEMARTDKAILNRPGGFVRLAWIDEIDGSMQFCRAYLPPDYNASKRWPLVLQLHGYNPPNPPYIRWWAVDDRHNDVAETHHVIYIEPHGRGNAQYVGIGEQDVLRCITEAKKRFSVDEDRVYITGESMGGSGTWIVASRHPDIFAAAAPFFGGWDYRILPGTSMGNPHADSPPEQYGKEVQSSFVNAENLLNVPVFVRHGDADRAVNVEFSRHATRLLQRWGYDIRYYELPNWAHEDFKMRGTTVDWFMGHRRMTAPRKVCIRSQDLGAASVNWVRVEMRDDPFQLIRVDAEVVEPGLISLNTSNVTSVTLSPPPELTGKNRTLRIFWNGTTRQETLSRGGKVTLAVPGDVTESLRKSPELDGSLSKFITTPFALVVGTSSTDSLMRQRCAEKAEAFGKMWNEWQHTQPRIFRDNEITAAEEKQYSLLLIGGADANLVTRRLSGDLPLEVRPNAITIEGCEFPVTDAVVQMIYPSPLNHERYVEVVAGTSAAGLYFWNPLHWNSSFGYQTLTADWIIRDGRRVTLENGLGSQRGWVAEGSFDRHWRRDDRWIFPGDSAIRAQSPLRHAPILGYTPNQDSLNACAGAYEFGPGVVATVKREGSRLLVTPPSGPPVELVPESETEFSEKDTCIPISFVRNAQGKIDGFVLNVDGQEIRGKKK